MTSGSPEAAELIEPVIEQITQDLVAGTGDDLAGFCCDTEEFLRRSAWATEHSVEMHEDRGCLIVVEAELANEVDSLQTVASHLKSLWSTLAYQGFEASSVEWCRTATVLRFVTVNKSAGYYVTGRVCVSGGPYSKLAEVFERRFHVLGEEPSSGEET